jgi:riboflavin transporter FmnP
MERSRLSTRKITGAAVLAAISFALQFLELPMPLSPSFAKFDFSDLPALIGAFAYGPLWGVVIELVKNLLHLTVSSTGGIGELANFVIGSALVFPAGLIYMRNKTRRTALIGCAVGSVCMGVMAMVMNYFVLLPMFEIFMPLEEVIAAFSETLPFIHTKFDVVLLNALPMNILKGAVISLITMLLYKHLSPILKGYKMRAA